MRPSSRDGGRGLSEVGGLHRLCFGRDEVGDRGYVEVLVDDVKVVNPKYLLHKVESVH